jgi:multiple sugar transport system permease protein
MSSGPRPIPAAGFRLPRAGAHALLIGGAFLMAYPLLWMIAGSFRPPVELGNPGLSVESPTLANYAQGWTALGRPFGLFFLNSAILCALAVIGNLLSCTLAAFAFARLDFALRRVLFALMLGTIMLPFQVTIVPQYVLFHELGWINSFLPLAVPKFLAVDAFFVFLLTQFIRTIPRELDEAAAIDGCGPFRTFYLVILPLILPALATTAVFTFIWTWNDFFGQLLYLNGIDHFTVPVALRTFLDTTGVQSPGQMFAMSLLALVPVFGFFLAFQRLLLEGISTTGLRG